MSTKITFNSIGQEVKREQPFTFLVHYTCACCYDCPDFVETEYRYECSEQGDDLFFRDFYDAHSTIHPDCPKRKLV